MKTQLRLNSVIPQGVSGPEAGSINLIYSFLLNDYGQTTYSIISINQIDSNLDELIMKVGNKIHVNIRYDSGPNFQNKSFSKKNVIRLEIIHTALLRLAVKYRRLDINKLEEIRDKILEKKFSFDFICKTFKNNDLLAKVIVRPELNKFDYYVHIEENAKLKCNILVYSGATNIHYFDNLFYHGKWTKDNDLLITGKNKEVEIQILVNHCKVQYVNLTTYKRPPYFELMRSNLSAVEKDNAYIDWIDSLPPSLASVITNEPS